VNRYYYVLYIDLKPDKFLLDGNREYQNIVVEVVGNKNSRSRVSTSLVPSIIKGIIEMRYSRTRGGKV